METSLNLSGQQYQDLLAHLFPGDGLEAAALLLCARRSGSETEGLIAKHLIPIPYDGCTLRTADRVSWLTQDFLLPLVEKIERERLGLVVLHSHPTGFPAFSAIDNESDRKLFRSAYGWFDENGCHASAIMLPDGRMFGRVVSESGDFFPLSAIRVAGDEIRVWPSGLGTSAIPQFAERVAQTFGKGTVRLLQSLKAAVIGCSGTGSLVIEHLVGNCVGELVLVDPDTVEERNLNRIPQATIEDARANQLKTEVLRRRISEIGLGTKVRTFATEISDEAAFRAAASCDVVFGCMDAVEGRHIVSLLASAYLIPYFDLGVHIQPAGDGGITHALAAANYVQPGGASLLSREVYTSEQLTSAAYRRTDPGYHQEQAARGYLGTVDDDQPAVITLNAGAAFLAVSDFLARLHGFRLDPNAGFARQRFSLTQGYYAAESDGGSCPYFSRWVGAGDAVLEYLSQQKVEQYA